MKGSLSLFDIYFALNVFGLICLFVFLPPFFFETEGELSMVSLFCFWGFRSCLFLRDAFLGWFSPECNNLAISSRSICILFLKEGILILSRVF